MEAPNAPTDAHGTPSPDVPWLKRIMWVAVGGFTILIALTGAQAVTSLSLRERLDERDAAWKKRLDTLESDQHLISNSVQLLQTAKLKQDKFNQTVITMLENKNGRTH